MGHAIGVSFTDRQVALRMDDRLLPLNDHKTCLPYRCVQEAVRMALEGVAAERNCSVARVIERLSLREDHWKFNGEEREVDVALLHVHAWAGLAWAQVLELKGETSRTQSIYETLGADTALDGLQKVEANLQYFLTVVRKAPDLAVNFELRAQDVRTDLRLRSDGSFEPPRIVVVGTTGAGKSTVINAIIGRDLLCRGKKVATGTVVELRYAASASLEKAVVSKFADRKLAEFERQVAGKAAAAIGELSWLSRKGLIVFEHQAEVQEWLGNSILRQWFSAMKEAVNTFGERTVGTRGPLDYEPLVRQLLVDLAATELARKQLQRHAQIKAEYPAADLAGASGKALLSRLTNQADENGYCSAVERVVLFLHCRVLRHVILVDAPGLHDPAGAGFGEQRRQATLRELGGTVEKGQAPCDAFVYLSLVNRRDAQVRTGWDECAQHARTGRGNLCNGVLSVTQADKEGDDLPEHLVARKAELSGILRTTVSRQLEWVMVPDGTPPKSDQWVSTKAIVAAAGAFFQRESNEIDRIKALFKLGASEASVVGDYVLDACGIPNLVARLADAARNARAEWADVAGGTLRECVAELTGALRAHRHALADLLAARNSLPELDRIVADLSAEVVGREAAKLSWKNEIAKLDGVAIADAAIDTLVGRLVASQLRDLASLTELIRPTVSGQMSGTVVWTAASSIDPQRKEEILKAASEVWLQFQSNAHSLEMKRVVSAVSLDLSGLEPALDGYNVSDHEGFWELFSTTVSRMKPEIDRRTERYFRDYAKNLHHQLKNARKAVADGCKREAQRLESLRAAAAKSHAEALAARNAKESEAPEPGDAYRNRIARIDELLREINEVSSERK